MGGSVTQRHPFTDLAAFPATSCDTGTTLWRITAANHGTDPWWFSNSGDGRFDLHRHSDRGTCYLAESLIGCLLETIWRDASPTGDPDIYPPIAPSELAALVAVEVAVPAALRCADVTGTSDAQLHTAFGITDAIGNCDNYLRPQQWAQAWDESGFDGVAYRLAHGTGLVGWALFGPRGPGADSPTARHALDAALLTAHGIGVNAVPTIGELEVIDEEAAALQALATDSGLPRVPLDRHAAPKGAEQRR